MPALQQSPKPSPNIKSLNRLVGTWKVSGEAQGQIRYEWQEGGFFLVQHFDLEHGGRAGDQGHRSHWTSTGNGRRAEQGNTDARL